MKRIGVIIPAGGTGRRMGGERPEVTGIETGAGVPKQFLLLGGRPVLARVIDVFRRAVRDADIVVALPAGRIEQWAALCLEHDVAAHKICEGGATRCESVRLALDELEPDCEYIAVHDAARPLLSADLIVRTVETARRHGSAIPAVELTDSIRRLRGAAGTGSHPEDRASLCAVQTPQVFRADILRTGYERAADNDFTDDATLVESVGYSVMLCRGERRNLKITEPFDLTVAESILANDNQV